MSPKIGPSGWCTAADIHCPARADCGDTAAFLVFYFVKDHLYRPFQLLFDRCLLRSSHPSRTTSEHFCRPATAGSVLQTPQLRVVMIKPDLSSRGAQ